MAQTRTLVALLRRCSPYHSRTPLFSPWTICLPSPHLAPTGSRLLAPSVGSRADTPLLISINRLLKVNPYPASAADCSCAGDRCEDGLPRRIGRPREHRLGAMAPRKPAICWLER